MLKTILTVLGFGWMTASASLAMAVPSLTPAAAHPAEPQALVDRYCITCHSEQLRTANLVLSTLDTEKVGEDAPVWEKVVQKLRSRAMPPPGMPRPDEADYDSFIRYLETELDRQAAKEPNPGRYFPRRLNRTEYGNAIRDLLGLEIDAQSWLPADTSRHGFDNMGAVLNISPMLLERYMSAARKVRRLAIGGSESGPVTEIYTVPKYLKQDDWMNEDLPFGSRGGVAIEHNFPRDGEYVVKIRLGKNFREYIRGLIRAHLVDVRLDGERIERFSIGGEHKGPSSFIFTSAGTGDPEQEKYERWADEALEVRLPVKAGPRVLAVTFVQETAMPEGRFEPPLTQYDFAMFKGGKPAVRSVTIEGPYEMGGVGDAPGRDQIFICRPSVRDEEEPCAEKILTRLARQAYRRPLTDEDVEILLGFFRAGQGQVGFDEGIGRALERILVGPEFLFRIESDPADLPPGTVYGVNDLQLASRLSFFLWSSIPDEELLGLAEEGKLKDEAILEQQVRRMLADPRAKSLVRNFAGQWLQLRNLQSIDPDSDAFPYFDDNLRLALQRETELVLETVLREDGSVLDLLDSDFTYVNERLARHYGIPDIYGSRFRRVAVTDEARKGILGHGSVLTVTSYANRTSPVLRGKWVLENILGAPPPPPPPDVPSLKERSDDGKILTMREQMELHRANPACIVCHAQMDPLGFALENFDGVGGWRERDAGGFIDSSGVLPDGTQFQGPAGLRKVLRKQGQQFVTTVAEKLLSYALGRGVEHYDIPALRTIMREAGPDYRWSAIISGVVRSTPFRMRRSGEL